MVVVNGMANHRANVITSRTGSATMGVVKAQMSDLLKAKLQNGRLQSEGRNAPIPTQTPHPLCL